MLLLTSLFVFHQFGSVGNLVFNKGERGEISVLFHFLIIRFVEEEFSYQRASSRRGWSQEQ